MPPAIPPPDAQAVVAAAEKYSRSMLRTVGVAVGIALVLFIAQAVFAVVSRLPGETASRSVISNPGLGLGEAGSALLVLLPVSIALQVLLRLPRDPEQLMPEEAVAQRQFWGNVSALVAAGSAFVAIASFVSSVLAAGPGSTLDLPQLFGAPLGSVVALIFAADAAATAQREYKRLQLATAYRDVELGALTAAAGRVHGDGYKRPLWRLIGWASAALGISVVVTSALTWLILGDCRATVLFGVVALILTLFGVLMLPRTMIAVLRGKPLDIAIQILPPVLVMLVFALQLASFAFPLIPQADRYEPWAYVPGIAYGLLLFAPIAVVATVLTIRLPWLRLAAPLLDYSRSSLAAAADRLLGKGLNTRERETWEIFAWIAIGFSLVLFVSIPMAAAATFHRAQATTLRSRLFSGMWICVAVFAALETAALLLLPVYSVALGWVAA